MSQSLQNLEKLKYLTALLNESKFTSNHHINSTLNFDTLLEMVEQQPEFNDRYKNEPFTNTIEEQLTVEADIQEIYETVLAAGSNNFPKLKRKDNIGYVSLCVEKPFPPQLQALDASHPWILYWLLNSKVLLGSQISHRLGEKVGAALMTYIDPKTGAIGGGECQMGHMAATYAGLLSLALSGDKETMAKLDTKRIYDWLMEMKQDDGSFVMHYSGEVDTRAVYCALCIASLLNILDDKLAKGTKEWLVKCQTYEGGFGGVPFDEAHGGYTFCAVAGLCILDSPLRLRDSIDLGKLTEWTVKRQYGLEGGLSGRTNKLVDGCYSHWIGGLAALLEVATGHRPVLDRMKLQNFVLCCCQSEDFGLRDKPGKSPDFYHTNYVLCGLSMCQNYQEYEEGDALGYAFGFKPVRIQDRNIIDNLEDNLVEPVDPIFGLAYGSARSMRELYKSKPVNSR